MRKLLLLLVGLINTVAFAQTFRGEGSLPKVEADGFYRISIPPALSPHVTSDFTNIRIYNDQDKEVPYLFQQESPAYYNQVFKEYEIVEKKQQKSCCTNLILRNPDSHAINNISLLIKNTEVRKRAILLGSDDNENWFALKHHFILTSIDNQNETSEIKVVDFPLSNYTYYFLQLDDSTSAPLNILRAGYYEVTSEDGMFTEVTSFHVTKTDSTKEKKSYIQIKFDTTQIVDKLMISVTGAQYFLRKASVSVKRERLTKKGEKVYDYNRFHDFELSSKQQPSIIELSGTGVFEFLIEIDNKDNPPLDVSSIKVYQLNRYLTAWLTKGSYKIKLGDYDMQAPDYDLEFFKDSIPDHPQMLAMGPITIFQEGQAQSPIFFTNRAIIWIAIVVVIVVLGFMTLKMVGETSKKE